MAVVEVDALTTDGDVGDYERIAHLIRQEDWGRAYVEGKPVRALCGKRWVPSRDPENLPLCENCKKTFERKFGRPYGT